MSFNISNYMEGVPVKISEKYKPPPKVSIPQAVVNRIASTTDDQYESAQYSYSFQLEKQVIRKLTEWKKVREDERENRRERIRRYELQKCRDIEEKQKQLLTAVSYPSAEDLSSDDSDKGDTNDNVTPQESIQTKGSIPEPPSNHHPHQNFDTILQPIVANSYASYSPSTVFNISKINYSDFENDTSSPFDNIELKTINDLDILAQVLNDTQKHSKQNGSDVVADEPKVQVAVDSDNQLAVEQSPSIVNSPSACVEVSESNNDKQAAAPTLGSNQNQASNFYYTANVIPSNYQMMVQQTHSLHLQPQQQHHPHHQHQQHQHQQHQQQQYMLNYANMNHHNMESVSAADVYFNYNNLPTASNHNYLYRDYTTHQTETAVGLSPNAKYYPNEVLANNYCDSQYGLHSVDVVAAGNRLDAEMIPKSKSKSVPDILKELKDEIRDSEIRRTRNHSQTMDDDQSKRNSSDSAQSLSSPPPVTRSSSSSSSTSFMKLSPSSQTLAKNISSMGFPLERVSKIAEMYGNDDKKIVEHLIVLSELLDLGFEEAKISEALVKFDNNKDKALDFLIS